MYRNFLKVHCKFYLIDIYFKTNLVHTAIAVTVTSYGPQFYLGGLNRSLRINLSYAYSYKNSLNVVFDGVLIKGANNNIIIIYNNSNNNV